jgi:hypothetical protein
MGFRRPGPNMMRPNMGRPDAPAMIPQVQQARIIDYVKQLESQNRLLRQGLIPNASGAAMAGNLANSLPPELYPGNVGNLANVIWPYWFPTVPQDPLNPGVLPGTSTRISFTVSQEAAFVMLNLVKVVHFDNAGIWTYKDPDDFNVSTSNENDLSFAMRDSSSTRDFIQSPIPFDAIGDPGNPTPLPTPMWIKENGSIEFFVGNAPGSAFTYFPKIIAFGYRIRTDAYEKILSGVTG